MVKIKGLLLAGLLSVGCMSIDVQASDVQASDKVEEVVKALVELTPRWSLLGWFFGTSIKVTHEWDSTWNRKTVKISPKYTGGGLVVGALIFGFLSLASVVQISHCIQKVSENSIERAEKLQNEQD